MDDAPGRARGAAEGESQSKSLVYGQKPEAAVATDTVTGTSERPSDTWTVAEVTGGTAVPGARLTVNTRPLTVARTNPLSEAAT